jgi:hypothetical protein
MRRRGLLLAIALVLATNAVVLLGIARNRSGAESTLVLTEREAYLQRAGREDTGLSLSVRWQDGTDWNERGWFGRETLAAVGFDVSVPVDDLQEDDAPTFYRDRLSRPALVVYELEGGAWRRWRDARERQHAEMREEGRDDESVREVESFHANRMAAESRLFAIDAGRDADDLRERYPDRDRYAIVPSRVSIGVQTRRDPDTGKLAERWLAGTVHGPLVGQLHVTPRFRPALEPLADDWQRDSVSMPEPIPDTGGRGAPDGAPRFEVAVSWGTRGEPWIVTVERLPGSEPGTDSEPRPTTAPPVTAVPDEPATRGKETER